MSSNWSTTTLGDCADFFSGGTPRKSNEDYWGGTIPWFSGKDLKSFYLNDSDDHVTEEGAEAGSRLMPAGTILLLVRGMMLHNDVPIGVLTREATFNQDIKALRARSGVQQSFLAHWLVSQKPRLLSTVHAAGHGTGVLATDRLHALELELPPPDEQGAIADVFDLIEDKIEQNRQTGRTLEGLARATFKAWFVDFEPVKAKAAGAVGFPGMPHAAFAALPDRLIDSPVGPVPQGWEFMPATAVAAVAIGKTPPRKEPHWFSTDPSNVRWVSIADMGSCRVFIRDTSEYLTAEAVERFNIRRIPAGSVLYSFKLTVGRVAIADGETTSNEAIAHFIPSAPDKLGSEYLYCYLVGFDHAQLGSTSSIATATNSKVIKAMPVLVPTAEVAEAFTRTVRPLFEMIRALSRESSKLTALRHYLLPRLLSGRVRLSQSEVKA